MSLRNRLIAAGASAAVVTAAMVAGKWEGERRNAYVDPVGIPTICFGRTAGVRMGDKATEAECTAALIDDIKTALADVDRCTPGMPPSSRAAFASFAYNVGGSKYCGSTLARKAKAGDLRGACAELSRWVLAGGKELPGLVKRRADERALCEQ